MLCIMLDNLITSSRSANIIYNIQVLVFCRFHLPHVSLDMFIIPAV